MNHVFVVRELIGGDIAGRSVNKLRNAVYKRGTGQLNRCGAVNNAGRIWLAVERPDIFVELLGMEYLADTFPSTSIALNSTI